MSSAPREPLAGLDARTLAAERWFADKDRRPLSVAAAGAVEVDDGSVAIVDVSFASGPPSRYTVTTGSPWAGLASAMGAPGASAEPIRPLGVDQSHTSFVVAERTLVKLYRRLTAGAAPEEELTRVLTEAGWSGTPALRGALTWNDDRGEPWTLAVAHEFVPAAQDGFELLAEGLADALVAGAPDAGSRLIADAGAALGRRTAELHLLLARLLGADGPPVDPVAWIAGAERDLQAALGVLHPRDAAVVRTLEPRIRSALRAVEDADHAAPGQRIHGDLHLGQTLRTPGGWLLVDFEGAPLLDASARRAKRPPMDDLASLLRSLDHVARSAARRAASRPDAPAADAGVVVGDWIAASRDAVLGAYARSGGRIDAALLGAVEVRKELAELRYAATTLPSWLWAPLAGLPAALELGAVA